MPLEPDPCIARVFRVKKICVIELSLVINQMICVSNGNQGTVSSKVKIHWSLWSIPAFRVLSVILKLTEKKFQHPTFQEQNSRHLLLKFDKSNKHDSTLCPCVVIPKKQSGELLIKTKCRYLGVAGWSCRRSATEQSKEATWIIPCEVGSQIIVFNPARFDSFHNIFRTWLIFSREQWLCTIVLL